MPKIVKLRRTLEALKIQFLDETVESLSEGDKMVGLDSLKKRQAAVDAFQGDPEVTMFPGTTSAAGLGITLTVGNYAAFAPLPYTPSVDAAGRGSCFPPGAAAMLLG
ncbi:hypothetical protein [Xenophilus azovorans]|uniref:hypothetical protein n=1 Tax=Xenophilus azovorans TaxID=151755 RepID=UPI001B80379D|nr:hypothetical protein [Xenophilus azovorans]